MIYDDTLILFGRSPYINGIKRYIPEICEKWHTMGCNYFVNTFPQIEYVVFSDKDVNPDFKSNHVVVTNILRSNYNTPVGKRLYNHKFKEFYYFVKTPTFQEDISKNKLSFYLHTPTVALNWAYLHNFKNVVMIGIDLLDNTDHFDKNSTPDIDTCNWGDSCINNMRKHIEEVNGKYLNLYTTNLKNGLNIKKIKITDLIKGV